MIGPQVANPEFTLWPRILGLSATLLSTLLVVYVITVIRDFTERAEAIGYMTRARTGGHGHLLDQGIE